MVRPVAPGLWTNALIPESARLIVGTTGRPFTFSTRTVNRAAALLRAHPNKSVQVPFLYNPYQVTHLPYPKNMNQESNSVLSNNNLRRMHGWARTLYPNDWPDRCAVVVEYLAQQDEDTFAALIKKGWPDIFAIAEKEWPEAFVGWQFVESEST